ncbi:MAG: hypothetical protein K8T91_12960 [Planctomycetes bacterium]|nr:hypothetical protein [Planctomycetota bacterium]
MRAFNLLVSIVRLSAGFSWLFTGIVRGDFSLCLFGVTESLMSSMAVVNTLKAKEISPGVAGAVVPLLYLAGVLISPVRVGSAGWGLVIQLEGCALLLWSLWSLGTSYSCGRPAWVRVRDSGPYEHVRHPQAAANLYMRWGFIFQHACAWNFFVGGVLTTTIVVACLMEEKFLRRFSDWREYARRTPCRFLPFII